MCDKNCKCSSESNYAGCGCSAFDDGKVKKAAEKTTSVLSSVESAAAKAKEFLSGMKKGSTDYVAPKEDETEKSNTGMYVGIGAVVFILIVGLIFALKK